MEETKGMTLTTLIMIVMTQMEIQVFWHYKDYSY